MVVKKNTPPKSTATKATTEEQDVVVTQEPVASVEESVSVETAVEAPVKKATARPKKAQIDRDELIECISTRTNLMYISDKTKETFIWEEYNDSHYITMGELIAMKSSQARFLNEGWIIVNDEEAIEFLGLTKIYGAIFEVDNLDEFLDSDKDNIERILKNVPNGFKGTIAQRARERLEDETLDRNKIKLLESLLDIDLKIFE